MTQYCTLYILSSFQLHLLVNVICNKGGIEATTPLQKF